MIFLLQHLQPVLTIAIENMRLKADRQEKCILEINFV